MATDETVCTKVHHNDRVVAEAKRQIEILAAEIVELRAERDDWKRRRDNAVAECRFLHQNGKTREQWHLDYCGAMRAVARMRALADLWDEKNYPGMVGISTRIRATLDGDM